VSQEKRNVYKILVEKPQGKILLEESRHGRQNDIKLDLTVIRYEGMDRDCNESWLLYEARYLLTS
jgi:hypothetical protein